jgi:predicted transcriptional regulator
MCMRTTLNLNDRLMRDLKRKAAETGRTMTELVEQALRDLLARSSEPAGDREFHWTTVRGRSRPAVDLADRDALYDFMERED